MDGPFKGTEVELLAALAIAGRMRGLHGGQGVTQKVWSDAVVGQGPTKLASNGSAEPKYVRVSLDPSMAAGLAVAGNVSFGLAVAGKVSFHTSGATGTSGEYHDLLGGQFFYECILKTRESLWCYGRWGGMVPLSISVFVMEVSP